MCDWFARQQDLTEKSIVLIDIAENKLLSSLDRLEDKSDYVDHILGHPLKREAQKIKTALVKSKGGFELSTIFFFYLKVFIFYDKIYMSAVPRQSSRSDQSASLDITL